MAAQTARDRKKARMTELEEMVAQLEKEVLKLKLSLKLRRSHLLNHLVLLCFILFKGKKLRPSLNDIDKKISDIYRLVFGSL